MYSVTEEEQEGQHPLTARAANFRRDLEAT